MPIVQICPKCLTANSDVLTLCQKCGHSFTESVAAPSITPLRLIGIGAIVLLTGVGLCSWWVVSPERGDRVTQVEYGQAWPFTVTAGTLRCVTDGARKYVTLDTGDGIEYGLNGSARAFGFPDSRSIYRDGKTGADLQPLIDRGLRLCQ